MVYKNNGGVEDSQKFKKVIKNSKPRENPNMSDAEMRLKHPEKKS